MQFRDEIIRHKFPAKSGFEATYHFTIDGPPPRPLVLVVERPDLYAIICNGQAVQGGLSQFSPDTRSGTAKMGLSPSVAAPLAPARPEGDRHIFRPEAGQKRASPRRPAIGGSTRRSARSTSPPRPGAAKTP